MRYNFDRKFDGLGSVIFSWMKGATKGGFNFYCGIERYWAMKLVAVFFTDIGDWVMGLRG